MEGHVKKSKIDAETNSRIITLENRMVYYETYESITTGTGGTIIIPAGATILLDRYEDAGDCLILKTDNAGRPIDEIARTAAGNVITSTLDIGGNYVFSGEPSAYPVAIVYQIEIPAKYSDNVQKEKIVEVINRLRLEETEYDNSASGLNAKNGQTAIDELQSKKLGNTVQEIGTAFNAAVAQNIADTDFIAFVDVSLANIISKITFANLKTIFFGAVASITALWIFSKDKIAMMGTSTGKNVISSANTSATDFTNTLPAKSGTFAMTSDLPSTPITGTVAQYNTALTDGDFATLDGVETLTNKTLIKPEIKTTELGSFPATSGTTQTSSICRLTSTQTTAALDVGTNGADGFWMQNTNINNLSLAYPLLLNPNGGNVLIGKTTSDGIGRLQVAGDITQNGNRVAEDFKANSNKPSVFLNGSNAYISVANNPDINFGTGTFSIITEHLFENGSTTRHKTYEFSSNTGYYISHTINNKISVFVGDGTKVWSLTSTNAINDGKFHVIGFVCGIDSASSKLYIDGIEDTTATKSGTFPTLTKSNSLSLYLGSVNGAVHKNETRMNRLFNYALINAQMQKYCYDGIAYEDVGGNNTDLTLGNGSFATDTTSWWGTSYCTMVWNSGTQDATCTFPKGGFSLLNKSGIFTVGKKYRITLRAKSTTLTNRIGIADGNGALFTQILNPMLTTNYQTYISEGIATATGLNIYADIFKTAITGDITFDDIIVQQIGCVLDLTSDSIANSGWYDKSGNNLHATYTNALPFNLQNYKPRIQGYSPDMRGANVASATTITPTGEIFHVTGTTTIATINIPYTGFNGSITIIPDGIFTWTTAGNIALAGTAVVSKALRMTYDATTSKWYPSYT